MRLQPTLKIARVATFLKQLANPTITGVFNLELQKWSSQAQMLVWTETSPLHQTQEATKRKKSLATTTAFMLENKLHVQFIMFIFLL